MAEVEITTKKPQEDMVIINLKGSLDVTTYLELEKVISGFLNYKLYKIIVDSSELEYISSAGVGVFIGALGVTQEHNGTIVLVNPQPEVKTVLDLIGVTGLCNFANNMEDAFKVFG